jgi:translation initiation factor IF-3
VSIAQSRYKKPFNKPKMPFFDRNMYIKVNQMRVIDEAGENLGLLDKEAALQLARERELDLVLINPHANPPIAKIISWSKFKYEQSKKAKPNKSSELKEMWFTPFIEDGDIAYRIKRVEEFLSKGNKVKIGVEYKRGADRNRMMETMQKILADIDEFAKRDGDIKPQGRDLIAYVVKK